MYSLFHPLSSLSSITQQQLKTRPIRLWLLLFYMLLFYFLGTVSLDLQLQWSPFPVTFDLMSVESFKLVMSFDYKILIPTWTFFISTIFPDFLTIFLRGLETLLFNQRTAFVGWKHLLESVWGYVLGKVPESHSSASEEPADSLQSPCLKIKQTQISSFKNVPTPLPAWAHSWNCSWVQLLRSAGRSKPHTKENRFPLGSLISTHPSPPARESDPTNLSCYHFRVRRWNLSSLPVGQPWAKRKGRDSGAWVDGVFRDPPPQS